MVRRLSSRSSAASSAAQRDHRDGLGQYARTSPPRRRRHASDARLFRTPPHELHDVSSMSDSPQIDRRDFLRLAGAGLALAGLDGCSRMPAEHILPYVDNRPELTPGVGQYYATAMMIDGFATGLIVESHEGRPTKIEGNPQHPASLGASGAIHQASVLQLYDPDREIGRASCRERG